MSYSLQLHGLYSPWNSPGQNTGVGSLFLQGIFPTQGLNPGLLHCRWILSQLSHKGSPRILEWVAYPFSDGSSWARNQTGVSCIAGGFFTNWVMNEAPISHKKEILPCTKTQMHIEGIMLSEIKQRKTYNVRSHMWNPTENKIRQPIGEVWYVWI